MKITENSIDSKEGKKANRGSRMSAYNKRNDGNIMVTEDSDRSTVSRSKELA